MDPYEFLAQDGGISWWFDEQAEDIMIQYEDCLGG